MSPRSGSKGQGQPWNGMFIAWLIVWCYAIWVVSQQYCSRLVILQVFLEMKNFNLQCESVKFLPVLPRSHSKGQDHPKNRTVH